MRFAYLYVCTPPMCLGPSEAQTSYQISWNWNRRRLWVSTWALGTQPGFFKMTVSAVNCRATYPGPITYSLQNTLPVCKDKIGKHPLCLCLTSRVSGIPPYCQATVSLLPLSDELQTAYNVEKTEKVNPISDPGYHHLTVFENPVASWEPTL